MNSDRYMPGELSRDDGPDACQTEADAAGVVPASRQVIEAAEKLACLIIEKKEFQNFLRLGRMVRTDRTAMEILGLIDECGCDPDLRSESRRILEKKLEILPVMEEYRRSEQAARDLFRTIDQAISEAAGLDFAVYAQSKACG